MFLSKRKVSTRQLKSSFYF